MIQNNPVIRLMAVGDIMLGDSSHFLGRGVGTAVRAHGADFLFVHVRDLLSRADLFFFNLESPVSSNNGVDYQTKLYRAPANATASLKFGAVNIASLANNHILQHGPSLLQETRSCLEKGGITGVGFSPNRRDDLRTTRLVVGGFIVSIHCESLIKDCTGEVIDHSKIEDRIVRSFSMMPADIRIVSLHWGDEYVPVPAPSQQQLAHRLVERGANLILGHHPHVLQPVEEYKGALIAYSLGNFIFDQEWSQETKTGLIAKHTFFNKKLVDSQLIPIFIKNYSQPEFLEGVKKELVLRRFMVNEKEIFEVAEGEAHLDVIFFELDSEGKCTKIERVS